MVKFSPDFENLEYTNLEPANRHEALTKKTVYSIRQIIFHKKYFYINMLDTKNEKEVRKSCGFRKMSLSEGKTLTIRHKKSRTFLMPGLFF